MTTFKIKRAYDEPSRDDGARILIDRLWPRGVSKEKARLDGWPKEAAPSSELRTWFHGNPDSRFAEFKKRYEAELKSRKEEIVSLFKSHKDRITLITAARDVERSHAPILKSFLERLP